MRMETEMKKSLTNGGTVHGHRNIKWHMVITAILTCLKNFFISGWIQLGSIRPEHQSHMMIT